MCDLIDVRYTDNVFDSTCGTGGFLIAAVSRMLSQINALPKLRVKREAMKYQPYKFYTGQNILVLCNPHLNYHTGIFLCAMISKQMVKFNWGGNGATLGRFKKLTILLSSTPENTPDYNYMEQYMRSEEMKMIKR